MTYLHNKYKMSRPNQPKFSCNWFVTILFAMYMHYALYNANAIPVKENALTISF